MKAKLSSLALVAILAMGAWPVAAETAPIAAEKPAEAAAQPFDGRDVLATSQAKLAWRLIERLSKSGTADLIVSPASLASALAIVAEGADAAMKAAISKTLGFPGASDPGKNLAALAGARGALTADNGGIFQFAERIVLAPDAAPSPALLERLDKLGIPHTAEDLSKPEVVTKIDAWVAEVTKGVIPEILGGPLDKASFVTLDALHFKGRWKTRFDARLTGPAPFKSVDGKTTEVALMHLPEDPYAFRADKAFVGVDLPFSDERFSLVVVTTTGKPGAATDFEKAGDWLSGAGFAPRKGDLALPRFELSEGSELLPALDALGLEKGRRSPTALAEFAKGTLLTRVVQRASIKVDEEGAEAAAATAVTGMRALEQDNALHMVVDRPFVFALRDRATGLILVAGYVAQASARKAGQ